MQGAISAMAMQVVENALSDFVGEILIGAVLVVVYFAKENWRAKQDRQLIKQELRMSQDKTRLDKHEERLDNVNDALDEFQQSIERIERHFTGDKDDPANNGLLEETHGLKNDVQEIKGLLTEMERQMDGVDLDIENSD